MTSVSRIAFGLCLGMALGFHAFATGAPPDAAAQVRESDGREHGQGWGPFDFAFIGDMPYGPAAETQLDRVIAQINADPSVRFVVHAGDIKAGSERCDDALILRRFAQYETLRRPFVYTPGDNEWTDCHRTNNGAYLPTERLAFLRSVFFPRPGRTTGGRPMRVRTQADDPPFAEFVENVLFQWNRVTFATVHVVGSNNDLDPWSGIDAGDTYATPRPDRLAEFASRQAAALAWLDATFDAARSAGASAVFLTIQANPNFELAAADQQRLGFNAVLDRLAARAAAFGKPVVLAHGDNHVFFVDKPLPNLLFSRMQTFGSGQVHWVKVHVDPSSAGVFSAEEQVVRANLP
ncbi:MAG: hypothetical protein R2745_00905 [Vicinamibacterales bacterium]